jgi:hypothetical protein
MPSFQPSLGLAPWDAVIKIAPDGSLSSIHADWLHDLGGRVESHRASTIEPENGQFFLWRVRVSVDFQGEQPSNFRDLGLFPTRTAGLEAEKRFFNAILEAEAHGKTTN